MAAAATAADATAHEDAEAEAALDAAAAEFEASLGAKTQPQATTTLNLFPNMPYTL
ncbi:uncharacterized protein DS421_19g644580 [Arachis hypogaea]|uniref:Uncharacterized protein n=1 Tax=Arachis hypogaea TaxID=3818 RepID=A0A6B9V575_ARAHY|nr:uncharacterized protein DS421_19g644580 [Arachis hypogaea]